MAVNQCTSQGARLLPGELLHAVMMILIPRLLDQCGFGPGTNARRLNRSENRESCEINPSYRQFEGNRRWNAILCELAITGSICGLGKVTIDVVGASVGPWAIQITVKHV